MKTVREIYEYREMIFSLVKRDLRGRYKGSVLGFLWTFINPLLQLMVYTLVFSVIMRNGIKDYYLFLFVALIFLPIIMVVEYVLALGMALLFSALTVFLRDLMHVMGIVTMAWQFMTPIMYDESMVPDKLMFVFRLNPMSSVITAYRQILYYKEIPDLSTLAEAVIVGIALLLIGLAVFKNRQRHFAENL